jgi:hypothetical protein
MTDKLPRLLTEAEAAAYLGIKPRTLARIRLAGKIQFVRTSERRYRYLEEHLAMFVVARSAALPNSESQAPGRKRSQPRSTTFLIAPQSEMKPRFPKPQRRKRAAKS